MYYSPVHLVELRVDVLDSVVEFGDDDVLDSIDTSIGSADNLIKNGERSLERG